MTTDTQITDHGLLDAYETPDGYGIQCKCGHEWLWNPASGFSLDEMAQQAHDHVRASRRVGF